MFPLFRALSSAPLDACTHSSFSATEEPKGRDYRNSHSTHTSKSRRVQASTSKHQSVASTSSKRRNNGPESSRKIRKTTQERPFSSRQSNDDSEDPSQGWSDTDYSSKGSPSSSDSMSSHPMTRRSASRRSQDRRSRDARS